MSGNDWKSKISDLDSFWDLDSLVAKKGIDKKPQSGTTRLTTADDASRSHSHKLAQVSVSEGQDGTTIKRYIIPKSPNVSEKPEREYSPEQSLIHNVKIYSWNTGYNYYEDFYRDVKKYFNMTVDDAQEVPFFSYVPQYSQMSRAQMRWYLYFREKLRSGEYIHSDYSYILLYCFELINSAQLEAPETVIKRLGRIWKNYRKAYPQLNKYLSEWIVDFGLINGVGFPVGVLNTSLCELMRYSTLKEYYASSVYRDRDSFVKLILQFCSAYDHRTSRYYEKAPALYDDFIEKTLSALFERGLLEGFSTEDCTITRQAFIGALVPYNIKKKIEIGYCSFSRTNEFRYVVGDIVKYCENKIRAHLSVKSKLGVFSLADDIRHFVDGYALEYFSGISKSPREKAPVVNEYDRLYDVPKKAFSLAQAKHIEESSWATTERLIEAFEERSEDLSLPDVEHTEQEIAEPSTFEAAADREHSSPFYEYKEFLLFVLKRDFSAQRAYAKEKGEMLEAIADEINALAADIFGDVLLEEREGGYSPIEDYISLIEKEVR